MKKRFIPQPQVWKFKGVIPVIHPTAYVHPSAVIIGDVHVGERCYIGPCVVLRGDNGPIRILEGANIQDGCVVHGAPGNLTLIEKFGHIGHGAVLHGCQIGENAFVGINSVVMDQAVIGQNAWVAAMSFVREKFEVPAGMLAMGAPAKVIKELTEKQLSGKNKSTAGYLELAAQAEGDSELVSPLAYVTGIPESAIPPKRIQAFSLSVKRSWHRMRQGRKSSTSHREHETL
jgi:phenylacetic acid degradation protein